MKLSKYISNIFHPIVFPIIGTVLYFIFLPRHINKQFEHSIIFATLISTYILPFFCMLIFKKTQLINDMHIKSINERKFPVLLFVILTALFGFLLYRNSIIIELSLFYFGISIALLFSYIPLFFNLKSSLHTLGIGALIGFLTVFSYLYQINLIVILILGFIISGLVGSARLKLKVHDTNGVFVGFILGFTTQIILFYIYFASASK